MLREKSTWQTQEDESTNAGHGGGALRSSEEISVIEMERRECIVQLYYSINHNREESVG